MKSITIHGIDTDLDRKISEKSAESGLSQNRTVKMILQDSLLSDKKALKIDAFSDLFGKWSLEDKAEFESKIVDMETVHESDWKK